MDILYVYFTELVFNFFQLIFNFNVLNDVSFRPASKDARNLFRNPRWQVYNLVCIVLRFDDCSDLGKFSFVTMLSQTQSFLFKDWSCFWFILIYLTSRDFFVLVATANYPKQYKNRTQNCHRNENCKFFLVHLDAYSFKAALIICWENSYYITKDISDLFRYWGRP